MNQSTEEALKKSREQEEIKDQLDMFSPKDGKEIAPGVVIKGEVIYVGDKL